MEQTADEINRLQSCINDLISVLALPAMWTGQEPTHIISTLLEVLVGMLRLEHAYARLKNPVGEAPIEIVRFAQSPNLTAQPREIARLLDPWLGDDAQKWLPCEQNPLRDGELSILALPLGLQGRIGLIVAGSERPDFPAQAERLLLSVAANQGVIGLEEARLLSEQKRVARELDQKVEQRTQELAAANKALRTAFDEIKALKDQLHKENIALREEINHISIEEIVGSSEALRRVLSQVTKVAPSDSTVLITGESGTGKELIARAIHKRSKRAGRAFIGVNCAAIPGSLVASELFGHEKGAFTGATQRRLGRFEAANGGTIFLDEVGDLPPDIQIALLRVLQEREIERVGSNTPIPVDVRVLAATHRDLANLVSEGKFRQDLLYRLNVVPIAMPSLRERLSDIPLLVEYFIARFGRQVAKKFRRIDKKTLQLL